MIIILKFLTTFIVWLLLVLYILINNFLVLFNFALWIPWTATKTNKWILEQIKVWNNAGDKNDKTEGYIMRRQGFFGKDNNAGENRRHQERRKTKYEIGWLHKSSNRHYSPGAEQSRGGQDISNITHAQGIQKPEPRNTHNTHNQVSKMC